MAQHDRRHEDGRERPRFKLFLPATMAVAEERVRVHLIDLSGSGAQVHATRALTPGTSVRLECAGRMRLGKVVHGRAPRYGIVFAVALTDDQVAGVIADQQPPRQAAALSMPSSPSLR